ncbi:SDR family NAD(P)-dependent oxidoreductase [Rubrolithibacter danxiaensis]|uniref:SDR family NAD(P)-dependent oxidoreductase n=1 Tax=Rubrolithibacter danxiaensis TaxID=3390805 RepID=UPI003BF7AEAA
MDKIKYISVLGCGWLGFPLAKELRNKGFFVRGATTTTDKLSILKAEKIDPFLVQFNPSLTSNRGEEFFETDILIVNIPPKGKPELFLEQIKEIVKLIKKNEISHVLFVSSTSVYSEQNKEVTEENFPQPDSEVGKALLNAEELFMKLNGSKNTVIRFAGLTGPGRDPGRFLSGKKDISNGRAPVNLIHMEDCIGLILSVIEKKCWGFRFNACSPDHPSREAFYQLAAKKGNFSTPEFKDELLSWKKINSRNIPALLGYQYKVSDWMSWLNSL